MSTVAIYAPEQKRYHEIVGEDDVPVSTYTGKVRYRVRDHKVEQLFSPITPEPPTGWRVDRGWLVR